MLKSSLVFNNLQAYCTLFNIDVKEESLVAFTAILVENSTVATFKKGQLLAEAGSTNAQLFLVISGVLRSYFIDEGGKEYTYSFTTKGQILAIWRNEILGKKNNKFVEAASKTTVFMNTMEHIRNAVQDKPELKILYLELTNKIFAQYLDRIQLLYNKTPDERLKIVASESSLSKEIPNKLLASYLGITPETYSRMQKKQKS